jgi:excisionase family DNA binding protein
MKDVDRVSQTSRVSPSTPDQWLSLKDASEILGVHFTTLRKWADEGEIRVFRTPGGHRRFSIADLRRFLEDRVGQGRTQDTAAVVDAAVVHVRAEIERLSQNEIAWSQPMTESKRDLSRQRGRQLFGLAIAYVVKQAEREQLLAEGRLLGLEYGRDAAASGIGLMETGRAVQFFRSQLNQVVRAENSHLLDPDDVRVQQAIDQFIDEVLYSVLSGYERQMAADEMPAPPSVIETEVQTEVQAKTQAEASSKTIG